MDNVIIESLAPQLRYRIEARSDIGGRSEQQDFAYVGMDEHGAFAVLCDGMGGTADGGSASRIAASVMCGEYADYCCRREQESVTSFLYHAMVTADDVVSRRLKHRPSGTTMVAACLNDYRLHWISAGDSRLYILRSGELVQATRDHNYFLRLREMLESGKISDEIFDRESRRGEALISYVGMGGITLFDLSQQELMTRPGDMLLLATDGLFRVLNHEDIRSTLLTDSDIMEKADRLMELVGLRAEKSVQDNTTFILLEVL